jgi:hypothetical protein
MKIYIASSWKHRHGVEMLTQILRDQKHEVASWIENCFGEVKDFETWVNTPDAEKSFEFDTNGVITSDLVIYYGNAGKDACVEIGIAYGRKIPILGLYAKGEDLGLMRKIIPEWFKSFTELLNAVAIYENRFLSRKVCEQRLMSSRRRVFNNPIHPLK